MATFLSDPQELFDRWLQIVRQYAVRGKQVHDARLLAFAQAYGITHILTLNPQDFVRYAQIAPLLPQEIVPE